MRRRRLALPLILPLACASGCAQQPSPPIVLTRTEVLTRPATPNAAALTPAPSVAVTTAAAPCVPRVGPPPAYPDRDEALRAAPSIYEQVQLLLAARRMRMEREKELTDALRSCARAGR